MNDIPRGKYLKQIDEYREKGSPLTLESNNLQDFIFCPPNLSLKYLW